MSVFTSDDAIRRFRSDVDDPLRGPDDEPDADALWKTEDVNDYLADAVDHVAMGTLSVFKTFDLAVKAGEPFVKLPSSTHVLDIENAYLKGARRKLYPRNVDGVLRRIGDYASPFVVFNSTWQVVQGIPSHYIRDMRPNALRLVPIPTAEDALELTAKVVPYFEAGMPLPLTGREDVHLVLLWMKKLAYSKHDADTYDPDRAAKCESEFEARLVDRKYEAQRVRRAAQPVRFSW